MVINSASFLVIPFRERYLLFSFLATWNSSHDFIGVHLARVGSLSTTSCVEPDVPDILHTIRDESQFIMIFTYEDRHKLEAGQIA